MQFHAQVQSKVKQRQYNDVENETHQYTWFNKIAYIHGSGRHLKQAPKVSNLTFCSYFFKFSLFFLNPLGYTK